MTAAKTTTEARDDLVGMMSGKAPPRDYSVAEAKARLRAIDEDLDIGPLVQAVNRGDWPAAGLQFGALWLPELNQLFKPQNLAAIINVMSPLMQKSRK